MIEQTSMIEQAGAFRFWLELARAKSIADCGTLFRAAIEPFGFSTFACGEIDLRDRDRNVFYLVGWPETWRKFYVESGLINKDPVIDALNTWRVPFTWGDLRADRSLPKIGRDALELCAEHGWTEGLVVPMPKAGSRVGLVSLAGHGEQLSFEARAYLCAISVYLHMQVRTMVATDGFAVPPVGLTDREIACLRLVAEGFTDAKIGLELGISHTTAHEFVEKAKHRLKVRSRAELAAITTALGIVSL
jgi:DNA-binding CsgD family transcriptional regulator